MINLDLLNPEQRQAVCHYNGPSMILAGAGTGKTRVITSRIAYMIEKGVNPRRIAAMTFTNKAAKEMQERISDLVGQKVASLLNIGTFHSFCLKILRSHFKLAGLPQRFTLVGTGDQIDLVKRALDEKGWSGLYRPDQLHAQIGKCKNELITPSDLEDGLSPNIEGLDLELLAVVYGLYERQLSLNRAIDFDDCILKVVKLLQKNESFRDKMWQEFRFLLVDEFQDTNAAQFAVLEHLGQGSNNICVVGDDDQSIYSWRGAMFETLEKFERAFPGTRITKLEQNYRCSNVILAAANQVIKNNVHRKDKELWSSSGVDKPIVLECLEDAQDEAQWIAEKCMSLRGRGYALSDIAILYRANAQAKAIEMALRECSLASKTYGGQSFFERKEVKDFFAYFRLIIDCDDHLALWRVVNTPPRGIGLKTQEAVESLAKETRCSPFKAMMKEEALATRISAGAVNSIKRFTEMINELRREKLAQGSDCASLGQRILTETGLLEHCKQSFKNAATRQQKVNNLNLLPVWIEKIVTDRSGAQDLDVYQILDSMALGGDQNFGKQEDSGQHISLMTIHGSKGLEFKAVFVSGLEDGTLPHANSIEAGEQEIAEERRLFYVAITRAKIELFLSRALIRQSGFQKQMKNPSRFLSEMPKDGLLVQVQGEGRGDRREGKELVKKKTLAKLSAIKNSLKAGQWD